MTISLNHKEMEKLRRDRAKKVNSSRRKRSTLLSEKTMKNVFKKFDQDHDPKSQINDEVSIDEHVKMNDSYMRTGWYSPKKK
ncbi:MAG: hypothetical protein ACE5ER_08500 [Nitrospinaceae bacterium]